MPEEINLIQGSVKNAMRSAGASSSDLWKVPLHVIKVLPNYNVRIRNEAYDAKVREIADSIKANGFYVDKPLSGYIAKNDDGTEEIILIGGHRRLEAVKIAVAEGAEITTVPMIVKPFGTSMEDLLVDLKVGNDGEPITVLEQAILCQRLTAFGWEPSQIAARLGYQSKHVTNLLSLAGAPKKVRDHVAADRISASMVIQLLAQYGTKAPDMIERLVNKGAKRVTAKDVPEIKFKQELRKRAEPMYQTIAKVQLDPAFSSLATKTQEAITNLIKEIQK